MPTYLETHPGAGNEEDQSRNIAAQGERATGSNKEIIARLQASLPGNTVTRGGFKRGGTVKKTGAYKLHKGEQVLSALQALKQPAQDLAQPPDAQSAQPQDAQSALDAKAQQSAAPDQSADPTPQPQAAAPSNGQEDSTLPDEGAEEAASEGGVNLHRAFGKLQEALTKLADESGVRRVLTLPFIHGGSAADHITAVSTALQSAGGMGNNLLTSFHKSGGRGFGSGDGSTQAWPATKLRETIIIKDDPNAIKAIAAARSLVNLVAKLVGDDDNSVTQARSYLSIIGKANGSGMTVADLCMALTALTNPVLQTVARKHSSAKHGGEHHAKLSAPIKANQ
jgi:hypothetical protein